PAMRDAQSYWRAVPNGVGCLFQLVGLTSTQFNEQAKSLDQRARTALGHEARNYAFEAYDSVLLVVDAIRRAGNTDAKAIVKALEQTSLVGTQGKYAFTYNSMNPVPKDKPGWLWHQYAEPPLQLLEFTKKGQTSEEAPTVWPPSRQTQPRRALIPVGRGAPAPWAGRAVAQRTGTSRRQGGAAGSDELLPCLARAGGTSLVRRRRDRPAPAIPRAPGGSPPRRA